MIDIELIGKIKNKKLVHEMCSNILAELLPRVRRRVEVSITFVTECDNQEGGYCSGDKGSVDIYIARRSYGDRFTYAELLITICHELVHAKQFLKGELTSETKWMGVCSRHLEAGEQPWEHEAFNQETILYDRYAKGIK